MSEPDVWSSGEFESTDKDSHNVPNNIEWDEETDYSTDQKIFYNSHFYPSIKDFESKCNIRESVLLTSIESSDLFELIFDPSLLKTITISVLETNRYQSQNPEPLCRNMKPWADLAAEELKTFIGLSILMGHVRKGCIQDYWSIDPLIDSDFWTNND